MIAEIGPVKRHRAIGSDVDGIAGAGQAARQPGGQINVIFDK
jgi:hypothetical protein